MQEFYKSFHKLLERESFGPKSVYSLDETEMTTERKPQKIVKPKSTFQEVTD